MSFVQTSYTRQAIDEARMGWPSRYGAPDSIDNWRHSRMLSCTQPLLAALPEAEWMTLGDGRYGSDAAYLKERGIKATATSLTDEKLAVAHENGFIDAYRIENAEHISLGENAVDFVLCKEAYHHFPRPPIALYEMLRVARVGAVLIEPLDDQRILNLVRTAAKRLLRGDTVLDFEPSGNFLYRLNLRELGKLLTAMGGEVIAFKGVNDFYHGRLSRYDARQVNVGTLLTRAGITVQDALSSLGLMGFGLGCVVVFKGRPEGVLLDTLGASGFSIIELPKNPYAG
ncbi:class I SAM-dependent methyltransferase [Rhodocyclus tenuis]|uniref:SAM-dependent methyltransferase n=1 Tax=Rhodocyclus tenuis TaxID=1066 RepID=A0A840FZ92_RHOTE|nr:class I SAM-dependent methyltransferase [Rhodocyclus tenuis]MBB4247204.1 SAM-dependent methyltransferase [Rhodocyclus tenuis]